MNTKQVKLFGQYQKLDPTMQQIAQLMSVAFLGIARTNIVVLANKAGIRNNDGSHLVYKELREDFEKAVATGVMEYANPSGTGPVMVNVAIHDYLFQEALLNGNFEKFKLVVSSQYPARSYDPLSIAREIRNAFYLGDVETWQSYARRTQSHPIVMNPFRMEIFERLSPQFQSLCLFNVVHGLVTGHDQNIEAEELPELISFVESNPDRIAGCDNVLLDLFIAQGNLDGLKRLRELSEHNRTVTDASLAFLQGNYDTATEMFEMALKELRKRTKQRTAIFAHLPTMFYVLLLLRENSAQSQKQAKAALKKCGEWESSFFAIPHWLEHALQKQLNPLDSRQQLHCNPDRMPLLAFVVSGWVWRWFLADQKPPFKLTDMEQVGKTYQAYGMSWLAAECDSILGTIAGNSNAEFAAKKSADAHKRLHTVSLADFIKPAEKWEQALDAIEKLVGTELQTGNGDVANQPLFDQRMIWEFDFSPRNDWLTVVPMLQKLNNKGWTKGRKVALSRLYGNASEYEFLTEHDHAIRRTLRESTERNYYGYHETSYEWDMKSLAKALVGHPLIFRHGDRTTPMEISLGTPGLSITKQGRQIKLSVTPQPDGNAFLIQDNGANRVSIVEFTKKQQQLADMISIMPAIPAAQRDRVAAVTQSLSSVIAVHSDIEGDAPTGETTEPDSNILVQLTPFQDGLRAELFVQPLGQHGPFCRPGSGAVSLFATIEGKPLSTRRDLNLEKKNLGQVLAVCHQLDARTIDNNQSEWLFESSNDALELVTELQTLADTGKLTVLWPRGKTHDIAGQAAGSQFRVSVRRDHEWFAASGDLIVDDELTLDMMKLLELVSDSPSRFVKLDDGRFLALTAELRQRIGEIAAFGSAVKGKMRFAPVRALAMEDLIESTNAKTDKHWKAHLARIEESASIKTTVPSTLQTELRDYQQEGFGWMKRLAHWNTGACLADDMGLGKTIQALSLLIERAGDGPALVVAPASVGFNWESETHKFAPTLTPKLFRDLDREQFFAELAPGDVAITSYGLLQSEIERFANVKWNTILLDEAQAIKNMETKRSHAVMQLQGDFRVILTGTPLENHLGEMWNLFRFIAPGLLGSNAEFRKQFAVPIERDQCRLTKNRLKKLIQPFLLRRTKTEVLSELPLRTESVLEVEMSPAEVALYEAMRKTALEKLKRAASTDSKKGEQHLQVLAELTRLRLACCHPSLVAGGTGIESSKLEMFRHKIREIIEGRHKVLVFSQFVKHLSILRGELDAMGVSYQYLDGSTPAGKRKTIVEDFQSGSGDVFLISLKAGGTGLNLTAADYVMHMDPWWNPAVEDQATDRAHRIGQSRPVNVYRFITKGTIEEKIVALHHTKRDLADSLLAGSNMASKLSTDDLIALLRVE